MPYQADLVSNILSKRFATSTFYNAGYITKDSRKKIINLAVAMRQREWVDGLWDRSKTFTLPVKFTPVFSP
ncbi:MAG: hypothetical protein NMNS01_29800 [Nitrosomonas sp.]|jgi:hypothetical protein|nr:MAG: hypothetical protein NMNS01_29800 [Nitrosomonas sp.]